ncbi:MAG: hypothetical protein GY725_18830 [bacterium]|nr:hypothetical protein [bacterium]
MGIQSHGRQHEEDLVLENTREPLALCRIEVKAKLQEVGDAFGCREGGIRRQIKRVPRVVESGLISVQKA